ncbi:MAG: antibiotic biosynthesis monooxygenase [Acidimicrobiales bacterium]
MLIVAGRFRVDPGLRDDFIRSREPAMHRSRQETGCLTYVFSADPIEADLVHLYERWETKEDLAAHLEVNRSSPRPPGEIPLLESEIAQYEVAAVGPVGS